MPRKVSKKINIDKDSIVNMLTEANKIYDDLIGKSRSQYQKISKEANDNDAEGTYSRFKTEVLKSMREGADGKLNIAKLIKDYMTSVQEGNNASGSEFQLTANMMKQIDNLPEDVRNKFLNDDDNK